MKLSQSTLQAALSALEFQRARVVGELDEQIAQLRDSMGLRARGKRKGALDALAGAAAQEAGNNGNARSARGDGGNPKISRDAVLPIVLGHLAHQREPRTVQEIADAIKGNVPQADQHNRFSIVVMHALRHGAKLKVTKKSRGGKWEKVKGARMPEIAAAATTGETTTQQQ